MITAMQSARHTAAHRLLTAREELLAIRSSICWRNDQHRDIDAIVAQIDALYESVVPNIPATR